MTERRLVIGPGGTGRTHRLRQLAAQIGGDGVVWLTGRPTRPPDEASVKQALSEVSSVLVVDDLQWFSEESLELLIESIDRLGVVASRRPWPSNEAIRVLDDLLTEEHGAVRVGLMEIDDFGAAVGELSGSATSSDELERLHQAVGGSVGLAADALSTRWPADLTSIPEELIDAVKRRIERAGDQAVALCRLLAVAPELDAGTALEALDVGFDRNAAQRAIRAGGLVDGDGRLIPLVQGAIFADLTTGEAAGLHDKLAVALTPKHPDLAVDHLVAGSGQVPGATDALVSAALRLKHHEPERALGLCDQAEQAGVTSSDLALIRAEAAFQLGSTDALAHLDQAGPGHEAGIDRVGFGLDVRDLRWDRAAERAVTGELAEPIAALARCLNGLPTSVDPGSGRSPQFELIADMANGLTAVATGEAAAALSAFAAAADDYDRVKADTPLGITPHALGAAAAVLVGDLTAADLLATQAIDAGSGGPGERINHELLRAYARLVGGDYSEALAAVRQGEQSDWTHRDRFLLAAIDAALARRSGDTTRLRDAWRRADQVLVRQSVSWVLLDHFTELLAAGARIGDARRVDPIVESLVEQASGLPSTGPGPVAAAWLQLQMALSREDAAGARGAVATLQSMQPSDPRASARVVAAGTWASLIDREVDEEQVAGAAEALTAVGDSWEGSRLLGQAALDHEDAKAARRLLEAARALAVEPLDDADDDGLVKLGLSEREAEVARLVAEGRTHKEVGAQLYISPKTVEHHVARIRQKLGATSRAELLSIVREAVGDGG